MRLINYEIPSNYQNENSTGPQIWRSLNAQRATAIDAAQAPNLALGWPGFVLIGGQLAYDETNPEACRRAARFNGGCK